MTRRLDLELLAADVIRAEKRRADLTIELGKVTQRQARVLREIAETEVQLDDLREQQRRVEGTWTMRVAVA